MSDVEARAREELQALAENAPSGSAAWELVQRRIRTRRRNRRFVTSAVVCIAVVAVAAGVLALHRNAARGHARGLSITPCRRDERSPAGRHRLTDGCRDPHLGD